MNCKIIGDLETLDILYPRLTGKKQFNKTKQRTGRLESKRLTPEQASIIVTSITSLTGIITCILASIINKRNKKIIEVETEDGMKFSIPHNISEKELEELFEKIEKIRNNVFLKIKGSK